MCVRQLVVVTLSVFALAACSKTEGDAPAPAVKSPGVAQVAPPVESKAKGSIDMAITAKTVNRDSAGDTTSHQCQMSFAATNSSAEDLKSLMIEFDALPVAGGAPVVGKLNLTMPMLIKAGATQAAWGEVLVDKYACEAIQLSFPPQPAYQCRTASKAPCAAYRYSATGIKLAEAR